MRHVFIVGAKGIPAKYGGFETFVDELVSRRVSRDIKYHVACMNAGKDFEHHEAECFNVDVPNVGAAKAVLYDLKAIKRAYRIACDQNINDGVLYILACRIGPFMKHAVRGLRKRGFKVYVNPDGHEWMRAKWNFLIRKYWKWSEKLMVKNADLLICDSKNIEKYIKTEYKKYSPKTMFIPYGADVTRSRLDDDAKELNDWYKKHGVTSGEYYLVLGRFVPENNYETIIREFMKSDTKKDLVIITNAEENKFYKKLLAATGFDKDARIKFVGTVYDKELVKKIRENSFAYIHGHSVGGTNPSLLEALASTDINILFDCGFNREVAEDGAWYFGLKDGNLAKLIGEIEKLPSVDIMKTAKLARKRIEEEYVVGAVTEKYEKIFENKKRKILFLHSGAELYGADKILLSLVLNLDKELFEPVVVLPNDGQLVEKLRNNGIKTIVVSYPIIRRKYFNPAGLIRYAFDYKRSIRKLVSIAKREEVNIIHNNTIAVMEGIALGKRLKIPVIFHVHETITHPMIVAKALYKIALKRANALIAVSNKTADYIRRITSDYNSYKIKVIHNGIDISAYHIGRDIDYKLSFFKKYNIPKNAKVIGMVGRVNAFKGQDDFLRIAEKVLSVRDDTYAIIVGDAFNGQEWRVNDLKRKIQASKYAKRIIYTGFVENMFYIYKSINILIFPSIDYDSFPTVVLESMGNKRPVVGYKNGGIEEIMENGDSGFLVDIGDNIGASDRVLEILSNHAMEKEMGEIALKTIEKNFSIERFVVNFQKIYNDSMKGD